MKHIPGSDFTFEKWSQGDPKTAPLAALPFTVRTHNRVTEPEFWTALGREVPTVAGDLLGYTPKELRKIKGFGRICLFEIETWLNVNGLQLTQSQRTSTPPPASKGAPSWISELPSTSKGDWYRSVTATEDHPLVTEGWTCTECGSAFEAGASVLILRAESGYVAEHRDCVAAQVSSGS